MKTCSKCGTGFSDDLSFCLNDGTMLPAVPDIPAQFGIPNEYPTVGSGRPPRTNPNPLAPPAGPKQYKMSLFDPASRMGCIVTFGQVSAVLLLILGFGVAGLYVSLRGRSDVAKLEPAPMPQSTKGPMTASNSNIAIGNYASNSMSPMATPAPSQKDPPTTISGGVINGKAISLPKPAYPAAAKAVRASGSVSVQVLVDVDGKVLSATAVSGHPLLRGAAVEAAKSAVFAPTILSGKRVKVSGVIVYNFVP